MLGGAIWFTLPFIIRATPDTRSLLFFVIVVGLALRAVYLFSDPILETDYYRYLWDGAATAAGLNPYAVSPQDVLAGVAPSAWMDLSSRYPGLVDVISYNDLRTIYPPVAQAAFAIADWLNPGNLSALRLVLILSEIASVWLLIILLREVGRSELWVSIYWWNPLITKEFTNSAHMDALLVPFLIGAVLLAVRQRHVLGVVALGFAAGVKLWPVLLAPLLVRTAALRQMLIGGGVLMMLLAVFAYPVIIGRLDGESGFVAYAAAWSRNDALFLLFSTGVQALLDTLGFFRLEGDRLARLAIAAIVGSVALLLALRPPGDGDDFCRRALIIAATLFLLSPTGYPWYYGWILPFLAVVPSYGLMLLTVVLPVYYLRFVMVQWGMADIFDTWIVWFEFLPVYLVLIWEAFRTAIWRARR